MPSKNTVAVVLDEDLIRRVRGTAERETIPISAVVRRALIAFYYGPTLTRSKRRDNSELSPESVIPSPSDSTSQPTVRTLNDETAPTMSGDPHPLARREAVG